MSGYSGKL